MLRLHDFIPDVVVSHGDDADGFGSAYLIQNFVNPHAEIYFMSYGDQRPPLSVFEGKNVIFTDFTLPNDQMCEIVDAMGKGKKLVIIDHHAPKFEDLHYLSELYIPGAVQLYCRQEASAIELTRQYFNLESHWIIDYVNIGDRWDWSPDPEKAKYQRNICSVIYSYPLEWEWWDRLWQRECDDELEKEGYIVERHKWALSAEILKQAYTATIAGHEVRVINSPILRSELASELSKGSEFGVAWYRKADGTNEFSLRSIRGEGSERDVSEIARLFGGNGHKHASAFRVPAG